MSRKKKKVRNIDCIAYLSTKGELKLTEKKENTQERVIREYAKAHNISIVGVVRRNGLGQADSDCYFESIVNLIRTKRIEGVIVLNMRAVSVDEPDAYLKVGKVKQAGGKIFTVDEGELEMNIKFKEAG